MIRAKRLVVLIAMFTVNAHSTPYICDGYAEVATGRGSELYLKIFAGSQWVALCSMTQVVNSISVEACKNTYALLLAAQVAKHRVRIWFDDQRTCSTQQPWTYAAWYFGPELLQE